MGPAPFAAATIACGGFAPPNSEESAGYFGGCTPHFLILWSTVLRGSGEQSPHCWAGPRQAARGTGALGAQVGRDVMERARGDQAVLRLWAWALFACDFCGWSCWSCWSCWSWGWPRAVETFPFLRRAKAKAKAKARWATSSASWPRLSLMAPTPWRCLGSPSPLAPTGASRLPGLRAFLSA